MGKRTWTEEDLKFVYSNYPTMNTNELAKLVNKSYSSIIHIVNKAQIKKVKEYKINQDYFNNWSEDMAYILGFTMADGCIHNNRLCYGVSIKDIEILEFIRDKICPGKKLTGYIGKRNDTLCPTSTLKIGSKQICNKLVDFGIIPRKTGKEILPDMPDEYFRHYLRGLFDGDGSISIVNKKNLQLSFSLCSANKDFLLSIKDKIGTGYIHNHGDNCYKYFIHKQEDIYKIYTLLYYESNFSLLRKKNKFLQGNIFKKGVL